MSDKPARQADTQASRRVKYGLSVLIAAVGATVLVGVIDATFHKLNLRYDFTVTREYTLSPQTRRVLDSLDGEVEINSVFSADTTQLERVDNLVKEYGRKSSKIKTDRIDPASKPTAFYERINTRFAEANEPMRLAVKAARDALAEVQPQLKALLDPTADAAKLAGEGEPDVRDNLLKIWTVLTQLDEQVTAALADIDKGLESPLPDYAGARQSLLTAMRDQLDTDVLAKVQKFLDEVRRATTTSPAVKNAAIELKDRLTPLRDRLKAAYEPLAGARSAAQYDQLRATLAATPSVVIFKDDRVAVIPVMEMFPDQALLQQAQTDQDARFLGEERLTGAIMSLAIDKPPMLVFVINPQIAAVGQRGMFNRVAQRLSSAGFDVRQWNPQGQMAPGGGMTPPTPPPKAEEGQRAVWVFVPVVPPDPQNFMAQDAGGMVASLISDKLDAGDGVLVITMPDPATRMGVEDPVGDVLDTWGITVQRDRIVLEEVQLPDQKPVANNMIQVDKWPTDLPVTQALRGMGGLVYQGCPIVTGPAEGVTHYTLVEARGAKLWAERDLAGLERLQDADYDEPDAADAFVIAAAAEKADHRLVVLADYAWATDQITGYSRFGAGTADLAGAQYPANAELFCNSVLWLAHMDDMIAASPRSQDIRRINPMDDATLNGYRWTVAAGVPAAIIIAGLSVWFVRRKG